MEENNVFEEDVIQEEEVAQEEEEEEKILVNIILDDGNNIIINKFNLNEEDTIQDLLNEINNSNGYSRNVTNLIYENKKLKIDKKINDYNILTHSNIYIE